MKWKLFLCFLFISIIPAVITGGILYFQAYKAIEEKISQYSQQMMVQSAGRLDALLSGIEDISLQIVSSQDIQQLTSRIATGRGEAEEQQAAAELKQKLVQILSSKREIVGAQILLKDKDMAVTSGEMIVSGNYKASQEYKQAVNQPGSTYWRGTLHNESPSMLYEHITSFSRKIYDTSTGAISGVLVLGAMEFAVADTFSYVDLGPNGFVYIMDQQGRVVSHLNKHTLALPAEYAFAEQIMNADESDPRTFPSIMDGQKFMVTYAQSSITGWYVVSSIPYSYLMERITEVGTYFVRLHVVLILAAILVSLLISISITRPVQQLLAAMKRVEGGDLKVQVDLQSNNEIGLLGGSFNRMIGRINLLIDRVYEVEISQKEAEIKALQSQINPHFLYNTLSVIDSMATLKQEKEIGAITQMLADIFRYSTSGGDLASIEEEMSQVQRYLQIQQFRYGDQLRWQFIIDPSVRSSRIIKLLLQPIVENCVLHGIRKSGMIKVIIVPKGGNLSIMVEDNGMGMEEAELRHLTQRLQTFGQLRSNAEEGRHIGLANVNRRIKSLYGEQYGLQVISARGIGTKVSIAIPIEYEEAQSDDIA